MRWSVFTICVYLLFAMQEGLRTLLVIRGVAPSFLLILLVFVAMHVPRSTVAWSGLILGFLADLTPIPVGDQLADVAIIGPGCLGYLTAGFVVVHLRPMVFRDSAAAIAVLVVIAGMFAHLVTVVLLTMRGLPWPIGQPIPGWSVVDQLVQRFLESLYSGVWAVPLGIVLIKSASLWGFVYHPGAGRSHPNLRRGR